MDISARRRKVQKVQSDSLLSTYPHDISMYSLPPSYDISLSEFEELALERLQLLRILDQATLKGHKPFSEDWKRSVKEDLSKGGLKKFLRLLNCYCGHSELDYQARRADHISHYILRLAYCRSEELRRWFLNRELEWFKIRFLAQTPSDLMKFLEINNFTYSPISREEKDDIKDMLVMSTAGLSDIIIETTNFYKVPFIEVISLVRSRRVFLNSGYAFIPASELVVCVQAKFRSQLNEALNVANHRLPYLDDDRIGSLLSNLNNLYTGKDYSVESDKDEINPAQLEKYSKIHFPLCMRHIHEVLKSTHHLKHFARLQYGLFLKAIGLSYENAMAFWREEFTKIIDSNDFDKRYAYNIKHMYGKVGNMMNYSPYGCLKIIMNNVGAGDHHGCPFKHWDASVLKQKMNDYGVSSEGIEAVLELVKNGHYQIACTKYYECTHSQPPQNVIHHPNQYVEESLKLEEEKNKVKT